MSATHVGFRGRRIVILGFGSIGTAVLPLILRHIEVNVQDVHVIAANAVNAPVAAALGVSFHHHHLTEGNFRELLKPYLRAGDFLLNVAVRVSSADLARFCRSLGVLYLDTSNESWPSTGGAIDTTTYDRRTISLREGRAIGGGTTVVSCHGANPGLASHFVKRALLELTQARAPTSQPEWAELCRRAGVVRIHISELDSQRSKTGRLPTEIVNTWSIEGFLDEAFESSAFALGTHEDVPGSGVRRVHVAGERTCVELESPGSTVRVTSWVPDHEFFSGFLIPHPESFSISDLLTLVNAEGATVFRPTVHFVYRPCPDAVASISTLRSSADGRLARRLLFEDIVAGADELGILLMCRHSRDAFWFGSELTIQEARALAPYNTATSLQVAAGALGGMVWAIENPMSGFVEPEQMDFRRILAVAERYLGRVRTHHVRWPRRQALPEWTLDELLESPLDSRLADLRIA